MGDALDHSSKVHAVIDYFGPTDFVLRGKTQPDRAYTEKSGSFALLGGFRSGTVDAKMEQLASPASYVSADDPPLLVFHGSADNTVLLDQSQRIVELYDKFGLESRLVLLAEAGHGGKQFFQGQHFDTLVAFLNRHRPK